ncbi:MAG TPA: NAD-dependent protein deacylase [Pseudothermotoga sp.]
MVEDFLCLLKSSKYVIALTGAGISTPSGIPDFRSQNGLYSRYPEDVFDIEYFYRDPKGFYKFWKEVLLPMTDVKPNAAHLMLARLEQNGILKATITQNIDGLHQKAGSKNVIELHGSVYEYHCIRCSEKFSLSSIKNMIENSDLPLCNCSGLIRPDIVFFGESLPEKALYDARNHATKCDLMIVLGSSLVVYPAAQLPFIAKANGAKVIILNKGETGFDHMCDMKIEEDLSVFAEKCFTINLGLFS